MKFSNNKRSLEKRNTYIPLLNKNNKGFFESNSLKSTNIISFRDQEENYESNLSKTKRKSQLSKLNNNFQAYKTTLNSNNSTKNKRNISKENNNTLITNENIKSQQTQNLKDDLTAGGSKTKIYNHESEKIVYPINAKNRNSIQINSKSNLFMKSRSKSEFDIPFPDKIIKPNDKDERLYKAEFDKSPNYNRSENYFNKTDLKNLEKINEINNSNSKDNLNFNNSNLNKSEFLKEDNKENKLDNDFAKANSKNINTNKDTNFEYLRDPNFIYNSNNNKNNDKATNQLSIHQRKNLVAATNPHKNSRVLTNSRMNTSNTEKKAERKAKKISIISPESFKTDFIEYENESRRKSALNSKRNSENADFNYKNKANRYSTVSTSNSKSRSKVNYNNLKGAFNVENSNERIDLNTRNDMETKGKFNENTNRNYDENNNYIHRHSKHNRFNSHADNYYDNLNFNYKNEFDSEIKNKINNFYPDRNSNISSAQDFYKGYKNKEDYLEIIPSIRELSKEPHMSSNNFETHKEHILKIPHLSEKVFTQKINEHTNLSNNIYNKTREIKPSSIDKFRDLSPIRESEYSYDIYKKRNSIIEKKIDDIDLYNNNDNKSNKNFEEIKKAKNQSNPINNFSKKDFGNSKLAGFPENNYRVDDTISSLNNLYEFKINKNSNFIYDEVQEKILPLTNFEGESYPENLYRDDKVFLRDSDIIYNRMNPNSKRNIEENETNKNLKYKSNEFNKRASTRKKITNTSISNSSIKKSKKSESFVPWDKVFKEKFREDFKNDIKVVPAININKKNKK